MSYDHYFFYSTLFSVTEVSVLVSVGVYYVFVSTWLTSSFDAEVEPIKASLASRDLLNSISNLSYSYFEVNFPQNFYDWGFSSEIS